MALAVVSVVRDIIGRMMVVGIIYVLKAAGIDSTLVLQPL
jgi:hypothetical protein